MVFVVLARDPRPAEPPADLGCVIPSYNTGQQERNNLSHGSITSLVCLPHQHDPYYHQEPSATLR